MNHLFSELAVHLHSINLFSISLRLLLAVIVGFIIGIDRGRKRRPAGIKTHVLVCLGAAMVMIISQYITEKLGYNGDVTRLGAQVISGIGFLGAGTILITGQNHIRGLTTAAGLWCSACVGLGAGIGFYEGVIIACIFIIIILKILPKVESYIYGKSQILELYLEVGNVASISEVVSFIKGCNCKIIDLNVGKVKFSGVKGASIRATLFLEDSTEHSRIIGEIGKLNDMRFIEEIC